MPQFRLGDAMRAIAIIAIYLAALHAVALGPSNNLFTYWLQLVSVVLIFLVMPFHVMSAWARLTAPRENK